MEIEEFERLWSKKHSLSPELQEELERKRRESRVCRSFAKHGVRVREYLADLGEVEAPGDFVYRMGVYARNHPEALPEGSGKTSEVFGGVSFASPFLRYASLGAGLVTGAALFFFAASPVNQGADSGTMMVPEPPSAVAPMASEFVAPATFFETASVADDSNAASVDDSLDAPATRDATRSSTLNIRTVGTNP